jgi:uncharacterized membrane protein YfcA
MPVGKVSRGAIGASVFLGAALVALYFVPRETSGPTSVLTGLEFLAFGVGVGAYGTLVGAGGGFLLVPALLLAYHADPAHAAGTSLAVVFLNALAGSISYARQRRIDYRSGLWFAAATVPGAVSGAYLARFFTGRIFDLVFGLVMVLLAGLLFWRPAAEREYAAALLEEAELPWWHVEQQLIDWRGERYRYSYNVLVGLGISFVVGFFSSVLGIGGGIIHVPVLIYLLSFPAHVATATSHFILALSAGIGAGSHLALGNVLFGPAILLGIGVLFGAPIGAKLARRVEGSKLVRFLSVALLVVGLRLLFR